MFVNPFKKDKEVKEEEKESQGIRSKQDVKKD